MLLRICLVIAIVGGLAAGALSFVKVQDIIVTTRAARDQWHSQFDSEHKTRLTAEANLKKTKAELDTTKKDLATTKSQLDEANAKVADLDKKNTDLTADLDKTRADRDTAQQELEQWHLIPGGLKPPQIAAMIEELAKAKQARDAYIAENKILNNKVLDLDARWNKFFGNNAPVILPTGLKGKIMAVDPKFDFVVLNIGRDQGVLERGEMMVNRQGKLLGKVRIASVQKDRCIANILPDWRRGEVMEGDEVLY
jgi:Skp family chaperone for outer membrane proteins